MTYAEKTTGAVARVGASDVAAGASRIGIGVVVAVLVAGILGGINMYATQQSIQAEVRSNAVARVNATTGLQRAIDANTAAIIQRTARINRGEVADAAVSARLVAISGDVSDLAKDIAQLRATTASTLSEISRKLDSR